MYAYVYQAQECKSMILMGEHEEFYVTLYHYGFSSMNVVPLWELNTTASAA